MPRKPVTTIEQSEFISAPPARVYAALVDAAEHAAFTGAAATSEAKVGGAFSAWDGYITGRHLELVPGRNIVQEWQTTEWPDGAPPSRLEFALAAEGKGTRVRLIHSAVPAEQAADYAQGWIDFYWTPLKAYFAKG